MRSKKIIFLLLLWLFTGIPLTAGDLIVQYRCGNQDTETAEIKPVFNLINLGGYPVFLKDITLRYYYTKEGNSPERIKIYSAPTHAGQIQADFRPLYLPGGYAGNCVEYSFTGYGRIRTGEQTGEIVTGFYQYDHTPYNQENDYSFAPWLQEAGLNKKVCLFYRGKLVWGTPPGALSGTLPLKVNVFTNNEPGSACLLIEPPAMHYCGSVFVIDCRAGEDIRLTAPFISYPTPAPGTTELILDRWEGADQVNGTSAYLFMDGPKEINVFYYAHTIPTPPPTPTPTPRPTFTPFPTSMPTHMIDTGIPGAMWFEYDTHPLTSPTVKTTLHLNSGTQKLTAYTVTVHYSVHILACNTAPGFSGVEAGVDGFVSAVNTNTPGQVVISGFSAAGTGPGSNLEVCRINWKIIKYGTPQLALEINTLTDENYETIGTPANNSIAINLPYHSYYYTISVNNSRASETGGTDMGLCLSTTLLPGIASDGWIPVTYTIGGTAENGVDYQQLEGKVYALVGFSLGPTPTPALQRCIRIKPLVDTLVEGPETVTIAILGTTYTFTIEDDPDATLPPLTPAPQLTKTPSPSPTPSSVPSSTRTPTPVLTRTPAPVPTPTPLLITYTIEVDNEYYIYRSGELGANVTFVVEKDGLKVMESRGTNNLKMRVHNITEGSHYRAWLEAYANGSYQCVSNIIEFTPGETFNYYLSVDSRHALHRSGITGDPVAWIIERDGVIAQERDASSELTYTYPHNWPGRYYRAWLVQTIDGVKCRVSNYVEYRPGWPLTYQVQADGSHCLVRTGPIGISVFWRITKNRIPLGVFAGDAALQYVEYDHEQNHIYRAWLETESGKRLSNIVEYLVDDTALPYRLALGADGTIYRNGSIGENLTVGIEEDGRIILEMNGANSLAYRHEYIKPGFTYRIWLKQHDGTTGYRRVSNIVQFYIY